MKNPKVVIIGAGPAGLSCGYALSREGIEVQIYEASPFVGGMARSFDLWGQRVDLGPHRFFSKEKHINDFFRELIGEDYSMIDRLTRIYYKNRFFNYPLKFFNVIMNLPFWTIFRVLTDYLWARLLPIRNPKTFEEWVSDRFGRKLFEIFFKHYSEKLWGIPCSRIDATWAAQRIKSLTLWEAIINAIIGNQGNKHKTLVDQFAYPKQGTGTLYERAAEFIEKNGGRLNLNTKIKRVIQGSDGNATGIELEDGSIVYCDFVISTMPLTLLLKGLKNVPDSIVEAVDKLFFRNTILVYLEIDSPSLFNDNWIYVHSPEVRHGRITNFRNWSRELYRDKNTSILCMEFWAFEKDDIWKEREEDIISLAKSEIRKINLVPDEIPIINAHVVRIPRCYPVYEIGYRANLKIIENYLREIKNLFPIGRYGAFKYNNQDHSILMGILAADKIAKGEDIDLWSINTDVEYQEEKKIKDVLLD